ncbi:putative membrane protein [Caulobacter ginsengisoli]|uniref:Membrane protein n=1 Tax=Caulobacter ginsengisoli TaxID=400775 RepID=A0ABU0IXT1_9CAUL|nr:DUF998 domain-containing protein [Caulobacter ginsengisoli]MDQ0466141.1 putative membrane protein [Caulobacter ginsengisoli]
MNPISLLLRLGALIPVIYYGVIVWGALTTPGFNYMAQSFDELGKAGAPTAKIFADAMIAVGGLAVLLALTGLLAMRRLGAGMLSAILASLCIAGWGVWMIMGGLHSTTDPKLMQAMGLAIHAAPLFLLWALGGRSDVSGFKGLLTLSFLAGLALLAVMMNWIPQVAAMLKQTVGPIVTADKAGLWQFAYSLTIVPWLGLMGLALAGSLDARARRAANLSRTSVTTFSD